MCCMKDAIPYPQRALCFVEGLMYGSNISNVPLDLWHDGHGVQSHEGLQQVCLQL